VSPRGRVAIGKSVQRGDGEGGDGEGGDGEGGDGEGEDGEGGEIERGKDERGEEEGKKWDEIKWKERKWDGKMRKERKKEVNIRISSKRVQVTKNRGKLHRNSRPWEMCQIQYNQTLKNKSPKIKPKLNRYLVATEKNKVHKKNPKDRLAHGGRCKSP
jgi:hypothetical protein